jgi:hypothetical protein
VNDIVDGGDGTHVMRLHIGGDDNGDDDESEAENVKQGWADDTFLVESNCWL